MKKFIINSTIFLIPASIYILFALFALPQLLSIKNGPNTYTQIEKSFTNAVQKEYEIFILGNSRTYRGIDPDQFAPPTFNFSHDNDSYNQSYYKLKFLEDHKITPKCVVLGIDYFTFGYKSGTRNYVYAELLGNEYLKDFKHSVLFYKVERLREKLNPKLLFNLFPKKTLPYLKTNGQYIQPGVPSVTDRAIRNCYMSPFQLTYFERIIKHCQKQSIQLFLVMPPVRQKELSIYPDYELVDFDSTIQSYCDDQTVYYLNYSLDPTFTIKDYYDITHLSYEGSKKLSKKINARIEEQGILKRN
ncbi:MAG: hypothetical protein HRT72_12080 [Flavobacteriales bacterium]|nr:hypothetical protein [Flavobacteriales bacterium]